MQISGNMFNKPTVNAVGSKEKSSQDFKAFEIGYFESNHLKKWMELGLKKALSSKAGFSDNQLKIEVVEGEAKYNNNLLNEKFNTTTTKINGATYDFIVCHPLIELKDMLDRAQEIGYTSAFSFDDFVHLHFAINLETSSTFKETYGSWPPQKFFADYFAAVLHENVEQFMDKKIKEALKIMGKSKETLFTKNNTKKVKITDITYDSKTDNNNQVKFCKIGCIEENEDNKQLLDKKIEYYSVETKNKTNSKASDVLKAPFNMNDLTENGRLSFIFTNPYDNQTLSKKLTDIETQLKTPKNENEKETIYKEIQEILVTLEAKQTVADFLEKQQENKETKEMLSKIKKENLDALKYKTILECLSIFDKKSAQNELKTNTFIYRFLKNPQNESYKNQLFNGLNQKFYLSKIKELKVEAKEMFNSLEPKKGTKKSSSAIRREYDGNLDKIYKDNKPLNLKDVLMFSKNSEYKTQINDKLKKLESSDGFKFKDSCKQLLEYIKFLIEENELTNDTLQSKIKNCIDSGSLKVLEKYVKELDKISSYQDCLENNPKKIILTKTQLFEPISQNILTNEFLKTLENEDKTISKEKIENILTTMESTFSEVTSMFQGGIDIKAFIEGLQSSQFSEACNSSKKKEITFPIKFLDYYSDESKYQLMQFAYGYHFLTELKNSTTPPRRWKNAFFDLETFKIPDNNKTYKETLQTQTMLFRNLICLNKETKGAYSFITTDQSEMVKNWLELQADPTELFASYSLRTGGGKTALISMMQPLFKHTGKINRLFISSPKPIEQTVGLTEITLSSGTEAAVNQFLTLPGCWAKPEVFQKIVSFLKDDPEQRNAHDLQVFIDEFDGDEVKSIVDDLQNNTPNMRSLFRKVLGVSFTQDLFRLAFLKQKEEVKVEDKNERSLQKYQQDLEEVKNLLPIHFNEKRHENDVKTQTVQGHNKITEGIEQLKEKINKEISAFNYQEDKQYRRHAIIGNFLLEVPKSEDDLKKYLPLLDNTNPYYVMYKDENDMLKTYLVESKEIKKVDDPKKTIYKTGYPVCNMYFNGQQRGTDHGEFSTLSDQPDNDRVYKTVFVLRKDKEINDQKLITLLQIMGRLRGVDFKRNHCADVPCEITVCDFVGNKSKVQTISEFAKEAITTYVQDVNKDAIQSKELKIEFKKQAISDYQQWLKTLNNLEDSTLYLQIFGENYKSLFPSKKDDIYKIFNDVYGNDSLEISHLLEEDAEINNLKTKTDEEIGKMLSTILNNAFKKQEKNLLDRLNDLKNKWFQGSTTPPNIKAMLGEAEKQWEDAKNKNVKTLRNIFPGPNLILKFNDKIIKPEILIKDKTLRNQYFQAMIEKSLGEPLVVQCKMVSIAKKELSQISIDLSQDLFFEESKKRFLASKKTIKESIENVSKNLKDELIGCCQFQQ